MDGGYSVRIMMVGFQTKIILSFKWIDGVNKTNGVKWID